MGWLNGFLDLNLPLRILELFERITLLVFLKRKLQKLELRLFIRRSITPLADVQFSSLVRTDLL